MNFEFFVARRYLTSRLTTIIATGGVFVGVSCLLISLSIMNGFQNELKRRILGGTPHILIQKYFNEPMGDYPILMEEIKKFDFVESVAPFIYTKSIIRFRRNTDGVVIKGVVPELEKEITDVAKNTVEGEFSLLDKGVVIGIDLANALNVQIGDTILIATPFSTTFGILPAAQRFILRGIFDLGMYEYNSSFVYLNISDVQKLYELKENVSGIEVKVKNIYQAPHYARRIEQEIGYPYKVNDWIKLNHSLFAALKFEKVLTFIVLLLIILVAAFNIVGVLIMLVHKKIKDIGILKSIGVKAGEIMRIFIYKGTIIGLVGTAMGVIFSMAACYFLDHWRVINLPGDVYFIETLPVEMNLIDFIIVSIAAIVISFCASLYPAYQASRFTIVDAIRYES